MAGANDGLTEEEWVVLIISNNSSRLDWARLHMGEARATKLPDTIGAV